MKGTEDNAGPGLTPASGEIRSASLFRHLLPREPGGAYINMGSPVPLHGSVPEPAPLCKYFNPSPQRCAGVRTAIVPGTPEMVCNHAKRDTSHQCRGGNSLTRGTPGTDVSTKGEESIVRSDCAPCRRNLHIACIPRDTSHDISPLKWRGAKPMRGQTFPFF